MDKEITKKFVENNGFICNKCGKVVVDGHKHKNEEDLCDQCKIADLEAKLAESESKAKTYAKEIVFLDKKLEKLNKEFELAQEHNEKTVEYWQNECSQLKQQLAEKDQAIQVLQEINQSLGQTCNNDAKEIERLREQLAEKEKEIEIEKKVSDWLYNIQNRTKFEEEVTQKYKTATEITKQCNLYEHCKNQYINDLRSEVKKKLKD